MTYAMKNILLFCLSLFVFSACQNGSQELRGSWLNIKDGRSLLTFEDGDQIIYDNTVTKEYAYVKENVIEVRSKTTDIKDQYEFEFRGDTLILTGIESREKYLPPKYFERPEAVEYIVEVEAQETAKDVVTEVSLEPMLFKDIDKNMTLNQALLDDIKPESKLYVGTVSFRKGMVMEVVARVVYDAKNIPQTIWRETVESALKRSFKGRLRIEPKAVSLEKVGRGNFEGTVVMPEGENMEIELDLRKSWMPKPDTAAMGIYTKYHLNAYLGQGVVREVTLSTTDKFHYTGTAVMKDSTTMGVSTDRLKGWRVNNTAEDVRIYAKYLLPSRMGGAVEEVSNVRPVEGEEGVFRMLVRTPEEPTDLKLVIDTKNRGWYPEDDKATLEAVIKLQLKASSVDIVPEKVMLEQVGEGEYTGEVTFNKRVRKTLAVKHSGKGFRWEFVQPKASNPASS